MANDSARNLPVIVIGAGSCGLAIAHGLQQAHIPVIVCERDAPISERAGTRDWAIACHWSGPILAKLIGDKWNHIQEVGVDPNMTVEEIRNLPPVKLLHGVTGEPFAEMGTDGQPFFRFLRSRLISFLSEDVEILYNKDLDHFQCEKERESQSGFVTAYFKDGTAVKGRLLIGADGVKSRVRSCLFKDDPERAALKRLPYAATFINASFTAEQACSLRAAQQHPFACLIAHPSGHICMLTVLDSAQMDKPETWKFTFYVGYKCSLEDQDKALTPYERLQEAKQMVRKAHIGEPLRSAYEWVSDNVESVYHTKLANWDPSLPEHKWDNHGGLVTLAGDASHPMTYHRGQGLNHAIADAGKLVEILSAMNKISQKERIDIYEAEMTERGGQEVRLSEINTQMVHDWGALMNSPLVTRGVRANQH